MYEVIVGNIGKVYDGDDLTEAQKHFDSYTEASSLPRGRASGENVTMLEDGEIIKEWAGWLHSEEF